MIRHWLQFPPRFAGPLPPVGSCRGVRLLRSKACDSLLALSLRSRSVSLAPAPLSFAKQLEGTIPREQHPWVQFKIGSWKRVKTITETLDAKGAVVSTSVTETTTKLVDVDDEGYTLRIDAVVEVAGKKFPAGRK